MKIKYKYSKLYWFINDLKWMKVYFSPFKPLIPKVYIGKVAISTPYFLPRKWVKATPERAHEATKRFIEREESYNKLNPNYARKIKSYDEIFQEKMKCTFSEPKKIGFDFVSLGWKTKWKIDDYRHEWNPMWSFVFFKWQIALMFIPKHDIHYWECWLYYSRETKGTVEERLTIAMKKFPCKWTTYKNNVEEKICYWDVILKEKYKK